jgi:hypothetical protein
MFDDVPVWSYLQRNAVFNDLDGYTILAEHGSGKQRHLTSGLPYGDLYFALLVSRDFFSNVFRKEIYYYRNTKIFGFPLFFLHYLWNYSFGFPVAEE